jgi:Uma2 family endonuclease
VSTSLGCILGPAGRERAYAPALVVISKERLPTGDARDEPSLHTAPDLAIEILSPGQPMRAVVAKIHFYLLHGVRLIWIIDPLAEVVLVLRPGEDDLMLTGEDWLDGDDVLPGFRLSLRDIFQQLHD